VTRKANIPKEETSHREGVDVLISSEKLEADTLYNEHLTSEVQTNQALAPHLIDSVADSELLNSGTAYLMNTASMAQTLKVEEEQSKPSSSGRMTETFRL